MGCVLYATPNDNLDAQIQKVEASTTVEVHVPSISTTEKGDLLEEAAIKVMTQDPNVVCVYRGGKTGSLDPVFFDKSSGRIIITECKNLGSSSRPGYVSHKSETAVGYSRLGPNVGKMMADVARNPTLSAEVKAGVQEALKQGKGTFLTVIGEHSRPSRDLKQAAASTVNHFVLKIVPGSGRIPEFTSPV